MLPPLIIIYEPYRSSIQRPLQSDFRCAGHGSENASGTPVQESEEEQGGSPDEDEALRQNCVELKWGNSAPSWRHLHGVWACGEVSC